jgi:hypothetical protein
MKQCWEANVDPGVKLVELAKPNWLNVNV